MKRGIAMIVSGFPRHSETFLLGELLALEEQNFLTALFATKPGENGNPQPGSDRLLQKLQLIPPGTAAEQAAFVASKLTDREVAGIHGYFAHTPAEVAQLAAETLRIPFGFSTHARDARKVAPDTLASRSKDARCVVACNTNVAKEIERVGSDVYLMPHGVDLNRFSPQTKRPSNITHVLAVGRLVEKKGFDVLIAAASHVKTTFTLTIVGDGPERERLQNMVKANRLDSLVHFHAVVTHEHLPSVYASADIVVVPSVQDSLGDQDGLPNVVLEGMACGRPVIASDISAINSAVTHGLTGLLVAPGDAAALAYSIDFLSTHPELRTTLSKNARAKIERDFNVRRCAKSFENLLREVYA
ncbi:MAG TPA: glycosyltransferase family 4 protein [Pyrinomonadaceae bacterium]|nr:glycosyltransferase family 4 protein [Pyrinomonadaceae bacterium]